MKVGIIGLPSVGKTTVLNAISGGSAEVHGFSSYGGGDAEANFAVVSVPDPRQDWLSELYKPKKTSYATVELVDVAGMSPGQAKKEELGTNTLSNLRQVDALVHVIRQFDDPALPHPAGKIDPLSDAQMLELELIVADLGVIEKKLSKIDADLARKKGPERTKMEMEKEILSRFNEQLLAERPLRELTLNEEEDKAIRGYTFLSLKPVMLVVNVAEDKIGDESSLESLKAWAAEQHMPVIAFCGKVEMDIAQLDESERGEFMEALGIVESSRDKLIKAIYTLLNLVAFFTVGEDEVKAWTIKRDTFAQEAAGKIHTDIARGFIRAEVCAYEAMHEHGTWNKAKDKGLVRLEGKEYKVQDGDCINFRFAV